MPLTDSQKKAGRAFRAERQFLLDERNKREPPWRYVLTAWRVVRHPCEAAGGASIGITLREHCEESPEYWICYCGTLEPFHLYVFPHEDCQGGKMVTAGGQFTFLWKEGRCSGCGLVLRSRKGMTGVSDSPSRDGQASPHPGDS
jgi:hypothetical protein